MNAPRPPRKQSRHEAAALRLRARAARLEAQAARLREAAGFLYAMHQLEAFKPQ